MSLLFTISLTYLHIKKDSADLLILKQNLAKIFRFKISFPKYFQKCFGGSLLVEIILSLQEIHPAFFPIQNKPGLPYGKVGDIKS